MIVEKVSIDRVKAKMQQLAALKKSKGSAIEVAASRPLLNEFNDDDEDEY